MIRVVIAEDHLMVREGLVRLVNGLANTEVVASAADGCEAIEIVERYRPNVLLIDIAMPKLDGLSAIPRILDACDDTQILVLSVYDEQEFAHAAQQQGALGLLSKSASRRELDQAIRKAARGEPLPTGPQLTSREREILTLIAQAQTNRQIADTLSISPRTVEHHCHHMLDKLRLPNRTALAAYAARVGLLGPS